MQRITRKILDDSIRYLNASAGTPETAYSAREAGERLQANPGHYCIDYAYGGAQLAQIVSTGGAERNIGNRGTNREAYEQIMVAIRVLETFKGGAQS